MLDLAAERAEAAILAAKPAADRWISLVRAIMEALPRVEAEGESEDIEIMQLVLGFSELEKQWIDDERAPREWHVTYPAGPF